METYYFLCFDYTHDTHKWGIEYANDPDGDEIIDVEWFETEALRNQQMKGLAP